MYGLGSFVKSIGKGIKKIVKSPIGKAAILGFGANALMPGGLSSLFGSGSFNPLLRKVGGDFAQSQFGSLLSGAKNFLGSNVGKFVAGATAGKLFGDMEPQQIEALKGDPEALRQYLEQYYDNLNLPSVDTNDENAMAAYTSKKEDFLNRNMKADGGRIGFKGGADASTKSFGDSVGYSGPSRADPVGGFDLSGGQGPTFNGGGGGGGNDSPTVVTPFNKPDINKGVNFSNIFPGGKPFLGSLYGNADYENIFGTKYNPITGEPIDESEDESELVDNIRNVTDLKSKIQDTNSAIKSADLGFSNGGRIGYDDGTPDPTYTGNNKKDLPRGLQIDTTTSNPMPAEKLLKENLEFVKETKGGVSPSTTMYMFKMYLDEALEKGQITKEKYNKMLMPLFGKTGESVTRDYERYEQSMANGGRINRAYGSDELVEQASGIEGLDININPKGVKELDLRETGGFIPPVGVKEKADDIPAMLSNNEFVFTADAVRAAGGGSVNKGAQIMYDTMKKLENGGTV